MCQTVFCKLVWSASASKLAITSPLQMQHTVIVRMHCLHIIMLATGPRASLLHRSEIDTANEQWHKVREEKLKADNLAQQRAGLESRIEDLESECASLQQQMQQDSY